MGERKLWDLMCLSAASGALAMALSASASAQDQSFVYAAAAVPEQLDLWSRYEGDASRLLGFEFGSVLVAFDTENLAEKGCKQVPTSSNVKPALAESWERDASGKSITFNLRKGIKSNFGNELKAEDVKWSLDRARELSSTMRFVMTLAKFDDNAVEVLDDYRVKVNFTEQTNLDLAVFSYFTFMILDSTEIKKHATQDDPWAKAWVADNLPNFGPWSISNFRPGSEITLERNSGYPEELYQGGNIGEVIITAVPESSNRLQLIGTGSADYAEKLTFNEYASLRNNPAASLIECDSINRETLVLNTTSDYFKDSRVRQAVSLAIDRAALQSGPYQGFGNATKYGVSPVYWTPAEDAKTIEHDVAKAKALLAEAGYPNGFAFNLVISPSRPGAHASAVAVQLQNMFKQIGLDANVQLVPSASEFSDMFFKGRYEAMLYLEPPPIADAFYQLNLYNTSTSFQNSFKYNNPTYDEIVLSLSTEPEGEKRQELLKQVSDLIVDDVPVVYILERSLLHAFSSGISNLSSEPHGSPLIYRLKKD